MKIAIRQEPSGLIYIDKTALERFDEETLKQTPYNFSFVEVEKEDCETSDFNNDLTFNIEKYNDRKQKEIDVVRISEIKAELEELNKDFIQDMLGAIIPNIAEKKARFIELHNELRVLQGKEPRKYNN